MKYTDLVALVGPEVADILVMHYAGSTLPTPKTIKRELMVQDFQRGLTPAQVAERRGVCIRWAEKIRKRVYMVGPHGVLIGMN